MNEPSLTAHSIPERPSLAPWYRVVRENGRFLFEHGGSVVTVDGRAAGILLPKLIPLLDGTRTVDDIVGALGRAVEPSVALALDLLAGSGLLAEGPQDDATGEDDAAAAAAFVAAATRRTTPLAALRALTEADVAVAGDSGVADEIVRVLGNAGLDQVRSISLRNPTEGRDLLIAAPSANELALLSSVNVARLATRAAWLSVLPHDGRSVVIGPIHLPGESACHACYRIRRAAASGYEEDFELVETEPTRAASPSVLWAVAAGVTACVAVRWLATRDPTLPGRCYAFETGVVLGLSLHHVLRVPRCPACGPDEGSVPGPWFKETARDD